MELVLRPEPTSPGPSGPGEVVFTVSGGTIGRSASSTMVLRDEARTISARHAEITFDRGRFFITDTSTNGVLLNDSRVLGHGNHSELLTGDIIGIGPHRLRALVRDNDDDGALAAPVIRPAVDTQPAVNFMTRIDPLPSPAAQPVPTALDLIPDDFDPFEYGPGTRSGGKTPGLSAAARAQPDARMTAPPLVPVPLPTLVPVPPPPPMPVPLPPLVPASPPPPIPVPPPPPLVPVPPPPPMPAMSMPQHSQLVATAQPRSFPVPAIPVEWPPLSALQPPQVAAWSASQLNGMTMTPGGGARDPGSSLAPVARRSEHLVAVDIEIVPSLVAFWNGMVARPPSRQWVVGDAERMGMSLAAALDRGHGENWRHALASASSDALNVALDQGFSARSGMHGRTPEQGVANIPEPLPMAMDLTPPPPLPEPLPHAIPEPLPHAIPEPLPHAIPEPLPHAIPELLPHAIPELLPHAIPEPLPHAIPEVAGLGLGGKMEVDGRASLLELLERLCLQEVLDQDGLDRVMEVFDIVATPKMATPFIPDDDLVETVQPSASYIPDDELVGNLP